MSKTIDVAIGDGGDRAAVRGFGRDVADHKAVRGAGEAAVGEQSDGIAETSADQRGGDGEHFAHAGAALGSFVANHDDIAGFDLRSSRRRRRPLLRCRKRGRGRGNDL